MDKYNSEQFLTDLLGNLLSMDELNEEMLLLIEDFLMEVLDSSDNKIFESNVLYNLLYVIEKNPVSTPFLKMLIEEINVKSLRVHFFNCLKKNNKNNCNNNCQTENSSKRNHIKRYRNYIKKDGKRYEHIVEKDENTGEVIKTYDIEVKEDPLVSVLDRIPTLTTFYSNLKLSENEL